MSIKRHRECQPGSISWTGYYSMTPCAVHNVCLAHSQLHCEVRDDSISFTIEEEFDYSPIHRVPSPKRRRRLVGPQRTRGRVEEVTEEDRLALQHSQDEIIHASRSRSQRERGDERPSRTPSSHGKHGYESGYGRGIRNFFQLQRLWQSKRDVPSGRAAQEAESDSMATTAPIQDRQLPPTDKEASVKQVERDVGADHDCDEDSG
ncbi:hypothetical protein DOTSEDRAFT_39082 [Dothistroma septosporum NZE10]|uniref:Uncharacterized protein n=1 Tax=Dothistroma septosporum (strain NZE10 / CBS 128990) TaxID=675120 RepID=M2YJ08_DOTSN|nr:hypothetical protein DOTSEDRAFT_39082 [Dothistroma septosporum NZE10]